MTNTLKTEVVVIGAGPGGYVAAIRAAQLGMKTVLIEENKLGGICLNYGCIPSKAMIYASDFLNKIKKSSVMGISVKNPTLDFTKMQQWKEGIVTKLNKGVETLCKNNKIGVIHGRASFETSNKLKLENNNKITSIEFKKAIVATGSKPIEIPNLKFDEKTILSSTGALYLKKIPKSLAVVGGGYIGLELGTVYAKLGSKVTIIEMTDQLLPGFEKRVVDILHKNLEKMNVSIYLNTKAEKYENGKLIAASKEKGKVEITADAVLVAVGRYPNTKALGLENTKASLDDKGFFKVDKNLRTTDENIYAIGDVSIGPMLAHKASYQGKHVAEVISGEKKEYVDAEVPSVIFTDPEIATVGLSEKEAKEKGIKIKTGKFPFSVIARAMTKGSTDGFVRIIAAEKSEKILGIEIVGADASDLIGEATLAIRMRTTLEDMALTIHPHPTLSEGLMEAAEATRGKAIHILNPK